MFEEQLRDTFNQLSETLRLHVTVIMESAIKELNAAAAEERARAIEEVRREVRAEAERENSVRLSKLLAAVEETVATLKREIGVDGSGKALDAGANLEASRFGRSG